MEKEQVKLPARICGNFALQLNAKMQKLREANAAQVVRNVRNDAGSFYFWNTFFFIIEVKDAQWDGFERNSRIVSTLNDDSDSVDAKDSKSNSYV